jgi:hypothetical protein
VTEKTKKKRAKHKLDLDLDRDLEDTFPASDPLKITRGKAEMPVTARSNISPRTAKYENE